MHQRLRVNNPKMFLRTSTILISLFALSGCVYNEVPMPEIVHDYGLSSSTSQGLLKPAKTLPKIPKDWLPPSNIEKKWTAITIHHSGTKNGSSAIFDKWHKKGNHWEGVGYDFVIGNGTNSGNGQVEVTFRWRDQKVGAHCGGTKGNWANRESVGICLVGNFNKTSPTAQQMEALAKLTRFLRDRYKISAGRIYGHNSTPGARATDCPGKKFPMSKLKSKL